MTSALSEVVHFFHVIAEEVVRASDGGGHGEWEAHPVDLGDDGIYPAYAPRVGWDERGLVVYWYDAGAPAAYRPVSPYLRDWAEHVRLLIERG